MPIYEYRCKKGHQFEVMQRMTDDTLTDCTTCGSPVQRVLHPIAVHFKGSGFYSTDYGKKKNAGLNNSEAKESKAEGKKDGSSSDSSSDSSSKSSSDSSSKTSDSKSKDAAATSSSKSSAD